MLPHLRRRRTPLYMTWAKNADGRLEATWHLEECSDDPPVSDCEKSSIGVDRRAAVADGELVG
jgi:hypothetical protein